MGSEFERIAGLKGTFGAEPGGLIALGIGDDCAVVDGSVLPGRGSLVWTVDACIEEVHFRRDMASWQDVGWRSLMAAASDVAAMGAEMVGVLASVALPKDFEDEDLFAMARGQQQACERLGTRLVGGNLSKAAAVELHTTCLGRCRGEPVQRRGAKPGHGLWVAGMIGWAGAGLRLLLRDGADWRGRDELEQRAVQAWRRPLALVEQGVRVAGLASAMIDVSDGVAQDAGHLAEASGVKVVLDPEALKDEGLEQVAARVGTSGLDLILGGGEDYALLATAPEGVELEGFRQIGHCERGSGVWLEGKAEPLVAAGHDHFRQ